MRFVGQVDVGTQIPFRGDPDEEDSDDDRDLSRGRFDLVIRPQTGRNFIIVVESKVSFDQNLHSQLEEYEQALKENPQFHGFDEQCLVSLTPWTPDASSKHVRLTW